jgi:predicted ATPase/DNA-binding CsgD family transcriptional regulator
MAASRSGAGESRRGRPRRDRPGNVWPELTSFFGRESELQEIRRLLTRSRLVTITGIGGIGKSRVASEVGRRVSASFRGGCWLVELARIREEGNVASAVAAALGIDQSMSADVEGLIVGDLDGNALLILDNCEHVADATAELADRLLHRAPQLRILATSRESLRVSGETIVALPALEVPDDGAQTAQQCSRFEAVQLFVARAELADPRFALTDANAPVVARICRQTSGIPLALELVASRVGTLSIGELSDALDRHIRFENLTRTSDERQLSMSSVLAWTYEHLGPAEQSLWRSIAVFRGGFTLAAAQEVCASDALDEDTVVTALSNLVANSIVSFDVDEERYRVLEPVRIHGAELAAGFGETHDTEVRHRQWCSTLIPPGVWSTGEQQARWMDVAGREYGNIAVALDRCLRSDAEVELEAGLALIANTFLFLGLRGSYLEIRDFMERYLARISRPSTERTIALFAAALFADWTRNYGVARERLEECERQSAPDNLGPALALYGRARTEFGEMHQKESEALLLQAVPLLAETRANVILASAYEFLAEINATSAGDHPLDLERADGFLREALACTDDDEVWQRGHVLRGLGVAAWRRGLPEEAHEHLLEALELHFRFRLTWGMSATLEVLAWLATYEGMPSHAARLHGVVDGTLNRYRGGLPASWAADRERSEQEARSALGESRYAAIYDAALSLDIEQAVEAELGRVQAAASSALTPLTQRELEIAQLISTGATNGQIAEALLISKETVKSHIRNILKKLEIDSRVQIASWYAGHVTT